HLIAGRGQESQQNLFPQEHCLDPAEVLLLQEWRTQLLQVGLDIRPTGKESVTVYGLPVGFATENEDVASMIDLLTTQLLEQTTTLRQDSAHGIALALAVSECRNDPGPLQPEEAMQFAGKLFACSQPEVSPLGKTCMHIIPIQEIDQLLN
ncbi:MAG: hypothetical protein FWE99_03650, partial [Bacteroidales bacterium]|nr:hypothetical protein [Bacteroidales bacterium]